MSTGRKASNEVLEGLCEKIQQVSGLLNGNVRKMFHLDCFVVRSERDGFVEVEFLPKDLLKEKLGDFDNLINAMGALFYVSKRMIGLIPCCLEAWKAFAFEQ